MAAVTPRGGRAQLVIAGALVLAVLFVTFAAVLNTSIYTGTLATRGGEPARVGEAAAFAAAADDGVTPLVVAVNEANDSSHADLHRAMAAAVDDWDRTAAVHAAVAAGHGSATLLDTTNGTHIAQDAPRNFTDADGRENWTLTGDATATRDMRLNVTDTGALATAGGSERPFTVVVDDGTTTWRATVVDDGGDVAVTVRVDGTTTSCPVATGSNVTVDVTNGSVGGQACPALRFGDDVDGSYDVAFENASNVEGTYGLVVDDPSVARSPPPAYGNATEPPTASPALYGATLSVRYESPRVDYDATVEAVPGDTDD